MTSKLGRMVHPLPALSLWNPHAGLMAIGAKGVESRGRKLGVTPGALAIVSTIAVAREYHDQLNAQIRTDPFRKVLAPHGWTSLETMPRGCIVALVWVMAELFATEMVRETIRIQYGRDELAFGYYNAPGRVAITTDVDRLIRLPDPVYARGKQGLWYVDAETRARIRAQVAGHKNFKHYRDALDTAG